MLYQFTNTRLTIAAAVLVIFDELVQAQKPQERISAA
jgi:hypothetical protein